MPALGKIYKNRGRWFIRLPDGIQIYCDKQHRSFYSKQHASWTLAQIHGEIEAGTFDADFYAKKKKSVASFAVYAEQWMRNCERRAKRGELSPTYLVSLRGYVKNLFVPYFENMNMMEIRGRNLKYFYLGLDYAPKTLWNVMTALHKLFSDAFSEEVIPVMPKFPESVSVPEPSWRWADEEQQDLIFQHLKPDALFMILFAATHGTRPGETRGLQHGDIDLKNDTVTIQGAFAYNDLRTTKSKRIRVLPLDPGWKQVYLSRPRCLNPQAFVFCNGKGKPHGRDWQRGQWNAARNKAGIAQINLYAGTRHSIASQAANRGASIQAISAFLGHSALELTKRYAHLATSALRQVQRKADVCNPQKRGTKWLIVQLKNAMSLGYEPGFFLGITSAGPQALT